MATTNQTTQEIETITADELRNILFHIDNEEKTVKELRRLLFQSPWSGAEVTVGFGMFERMGIQ